MTTNNNNNNNTLRILCFGNSLTAGYWHWGLEYHPYAIKLKELLQQSLSRDELLLPPDTEIVIDVEGLPGDLAISPPGRFLGRMEGRCKNVAYDWVIVLGGTNDLAHPPFTPTQIFTALQQAWSTALSSSSKTHVLALTIPESAAKNDRLTRRRDEVNKMILGHRAERFYTFDLHSALPYHALSEEDKERIWDDGLHLTDQGYDRMGEVVAGRVVELLKESNSKESDGK